MMRGAFLKSAAKVEVFSAKMLHSNVENDKKKTPRFHTEQ